MALDYLQPAPTQQGQGQQAYSPETLKMLREYSKALMSQKQKPTQLGFYSPWQGASDAMGDILGAWTMRDAAQKDRATHNIIGEEVGSQHTGYGNNSATASGGAGAGAPFTSDTQESQEEAQTPGRQSLGVQTASLDPSSGVSDAAMRLSSKGETGKDPSMGALFNISPDTKNSKSYGPFGLNSKTGSASEFAQEHPEFGLKAKPGTPEFDQQWRRASAVMPDKMKDAHKDWHQKHIMDGLPDEMIKAGVDSKIANDSRVQTYMADRKLQMGKAGLDTALMYGRLSNSPEEFIRRISQVDKQRIPYNFPSYLEDHPDNAQGLANRIDLRHSTALAMADPDTTGKMVDYYKNGQGNTPPTQVAQNTSKFQNSPLPTGRLQEETGQLLRGLISRGQMDPKEAVEVAKQLDVLRKGNMPEFGVGPYGQITRTEPGRPPTITGLSPGHPGVVGPFGKSDTIKSRTFYGPDGKLHYQIIPPELEEEGAATTGGGTGTIPTVTPPTTSPIGTSERTPPTPSQPAPQGAVVQAPTSPAPTPTNASQPPASAIAGGPLTTSPPAVKPTATDVPPSGLAKPDMKTRVASLGDTIFNAAAGGTAAESKADSSTSVKTNEDEFGNQGFDTKDPAEVKALEYTNKAGEEKKSLPPLTIGKMGAPNELDLAKKRDIRGLIQNEQNVKGYTEALSKRLTDQANDYAKFETSYRDAAKQAGNLRPGMKEALEVIRSPEFQSGPAHQPITIIRGLREQTGNIFKSWADDAKSRAEAARKAGDNDKATGYESDAGYYKKVADWTLDTKFTPTSNQIFAKVLAATTLQSLRGMLGPNSGQFRQYEMTLMREALGNENMTPEALNVVLTMADKMNDRNILLGKMAAQYAAIHGGLDPTFEKYADLFEKNHPPYTHKELQDAMATMRNLKGNTAAGAVSPAAGGPLTTQPPAPLPDPLGLRRK